ncbi:hypothetical protein C8R45DRAFT_1018085 [Mycena sanguinolenta]|nr:hypothetical protein C8R45DRAFT_1018085 [Mycena sanguinolenta]
MAFAIARSAHVLAPGQCLGLTASGRCTLPPSTRGFCTSHQQQALWVHATAARISAADRRLHAQRRRCCGLTTKYTLCGNNPGGNFMFCIFTRGSAQWTALVLRRDRKSHMRLRLCAVECVSFSSFSEDRRPGKTMLAIDHRYLPVRLAGASESPQADAAPRQLVLKDFASPTRTRGCGSGQRTLPLQNAGSMPRIAAAVG